MMTTSKAELTKINDNLYHTCDTLPRSLSYFQKIGEQVDTLAQLRERFEEANNLAKAAEKAYNERFKAAFGFTPDSVSKRFSEMGMTDDEGVIFDGIDNELCFGPARETEYCKNPSAALMALEAVKEGVGKKLMSFKISDLRKNLVQDSAVWKKVVGIKRGKRAQLFKVRAS